MFAIFVENQVEPKDKEEENEGEREKEETWRKGNYFLMQNAKAKTKFLSHIFYYKFFNETIKYYIFSTLGKFTSFKSKT